MVTILKTAGLPALCLIIALALVFATQNSFVAPFHLPAFLPVGLVLAGSGLGWRFGQSNAVLALIVLALSWLALTGIAPGSAPEGFRQILHAGISILLPANLLIFALFEERGLLNPWGLLRLSLILAQALGLYWIAAHGGDATYKSAAILFQYSPLPFDTRRWVALPELSLLMHLLAIIVLSLRLYLTGSVLAAGFLGAIIAGLFAFLNGADTPTMSIFMITAMAILCAAILQAVYGMAFIDELTGIPGRRALVMDMKKLGPNYVIAMADIDHFKKFNDTYGHDIGDQVLKMVATHLSKVGGGGKAYRYGGEEFCILLPGKNKRSAMPFLEEIRADVAQASFHIRAKNRPRKKPRQKTARGGAGKVSVTISIGLAACQKGSGAAEQVLKQADTALYRAKKAGRNCVST